MGIKFGREYEDIIHDFTEALLGMEECAIFLEMTPVEWSELESEERRDCVQTMADDLFYALGSDPRMRIGSCTVSHDRDKHVIVIHQEETLSHIIYLV